MHLVTVRGQLTVERTGVRIELGDHDIARMAYVEPMDDEIEHYAKLSQDIKEAANSGEELTSRQLYVAYPPESGTKLNCISMVQLLLGRGEFNTVFAVLRSSSTRRLRSDLGILSRIAVEYKCAKLVVNIGSFHVELDPGAMSPEELHAPTR